MVTSLNFVHGCSTANGTSSGQIRLQLHGIGDNDNLQGECWDMDWTYDWTMVDRAIEENSQR